MADTAQGADAGLMLIRSSVELAGLLLAATGVWPLQPEPRVVSEFDPPPVAWSTGHRGVDLDGTIGQPVHAALGGTVTFSGRVAGRAVVVVSHGSRRTTYEPVQGSLAVGTPVVAGQIIGTLEFHDNHCFPQTCLHWGLIEGSDRYLDPLSLIDCGPKPVRLLPLDCSPEGPVERPRCPTPVPTLARRFAEAVVKLVDELVDKPGEASRR